MLKVTTVSGTDSPTRRHGSIVAPGTTTGGGPVGAGAVLVGPEVIGLDARVSVGRLGLAVGPPGPWAGAHQASSSVTRTPVASSATSPCVRRLMPPLSPAAG